MFNLFKLLFFMILIISTIITTSANTWFGMWIGLEINLLSIIPLMNNMSPLSSEASLKYFITQAMASILILLSIILLSMKINFLLLNNFNNLILNSALLTKMGMAPFHFWFPEIIEGLSWSMTTLILTWQKIAPMIILSFNMKYEYFFNIIIITAMIISGLLGINQISIRKFLVFSSINHMAWMLSALLVNKFIWMVYFTLYSLSTFFLTFNFNFFKIFFFNQMILMINKNTYLKFFFILNFLNLGGIPPFINFFPKWLIIQNLIYYNFFSMVLLMVILTLMALYFYLRFMFSSLLMNFHQINFFKNKINNSYFLSANFIFLNSIILMTFCTNMA